jgi:hypothetical protein
MILDCSRVPFYWRDSSGIIDDYAVLSCLDAIVSCIGVAGGDGSRLCDTFWSKFHVIKLKAACVGLILYAISAFNAFGYEPKLDGFKIRSY